MPPDTGTVSGIPALARPGEDALEPAWAQGLRRALTVPLTFLLWSVGLGLGPILIVLAALSDGLRRTRAGALRLYFMALTYLGCEVVGLMACLLLWVQNRLDPNSARYLRQHHRLQGWWTGTLFRVGQRLFGVQLKVEGLEQSRPGPLLVLVRHASLIDTLLPATLLSGEYALRLRYVLKRELLWDPCLDVVGQRLPNAFVRRDGSDSTRAVAAVRALARELSPDEGVLVFPEGTRFSAPRRAKVLKSIERGGDLALLARARGLQAVLPPRLSGVFALLDEAPNLDVLFCAHRGFAEVRTFADLMNGALVGRTVAVKFWRVSARDIPAESAARTRWLYAHWARVDAFVRDAPEGAAEGSPPSATPPGT